MQNLYNHKLTIASAISTIGFGIGACFQPYLAIPAGISLITAVADIAMRVNRERSIATVTPLETLHTRQQSEVAVLNEIVAHSKQPSDQYTKDNFVTFAYNEKRLVKHHGHLMSSDMKEFNEALERVNSVNEARLPVHIEESRMPGP